MPFRHDRGVSQGVSEKRILLALGGGGFEAKAGSRAGIGHDENKKKILEMTC